MLLHNATLIIQIYQVQGKHISCLFRCQPGQCAQDECPKSEAGVPLMPMADGDNTQEEEDDAVRQGTHGFDSVLHCCVALLWNVGKGVALLSYSACNLENSIGWIYVKHTLKPCLLKNWKKLFLMYRTQNSDTVPLEIRRRKPKLSCQKFALESGPMPR